MAANFDWKKEFQRCKKLYLAKGKFGTQAISEEAEEKIEPIFTNLLADVLAITRAQRTTSHAIATQEVHTQIPANVLALKKALLEALEVDDYPTGY